MNVMRSTPRKLAALATFGLVGVTSACSTVSPEELDTGLAELREEMMREMSAGDEQVSDELGSRIATVEQRVAALESELDEMRREFEVTISRMEVELRFDVPVYFGFDDATLQGDAHSLLDRFASVATRYYPDAVVTVEGFTDPSGSAEYNRTLGQRRADAVREYLVNSSDLSGDRVRSVSYGEDSSRLIAPDETGPGQDGWQNRRVVLVIDHQGEPPALPTTEEQGT